MKKEFETKEYNLPPETYMEKIEKEYNITREAITSIFDEKRKVRFVEGEYFYAFEYKMNMNILSFGKFKLKLPFTVVALPLSVDEKGYKGDIGELIKYYMQKSGITLMLNLRECPLAIKDFKFSVGKTLHNLEFKNTFINFEDYIKCLRSHYRRRVSKALKKGENIEIRSIKPEDFDEKLYNLYLQVLNKSDFPLETLSMHFFQKVNWKFDVFYVNGEALAFVTYFKSKKETSEKGQVETMNFAFGGMDYKKRDEYDLYYNMLLHIIKESIKEKVDYISLGQTGEGVKQRLGAKPQNRYIVAFSKHKLLSNLISKFAPMLENSKNLENLNVFKRDKQIERL